MDLNRYDVFVYQQQEKQGYQNIDDSLKRLILDAVSEVKPGDHVVIKPNLVRQCSLKTSKWEHVITNPLLIKAVLEAVILRLDNSGHIFVLDAPQEDSNFKMILKNTNLLRIIQEVQKQTEVCIECVDIRTEEKKSCNGVIVKRKKQDGDPNGYVKVDLGNSSSFCNKRNKDYYGADYNQEHAKTYHNSKNTSYIVSKSVLLSDVYINMPKLKTHKIGGMTCCLKNAIGIIGEKNCIPHHTLGTPETDGDAYPFVNAKTTTDKKIRGIAMDILRKDIPVVGYLIAFAKKIVTPFVGKPLEVVRNGHWYGNDTLWRAILDLNKILVYSDENGIMHNKPKRKCISIIDAIVAGEKNGPMSPEPKVCGMVGIAFSPLLGDVVMSRLMGFDYKKIPSINNGFGLTNYTLNNEVIPDNISVGSNNPNWNKKLGNINKNDCFAFNAAFGWENHIELD